MEIYKCLATNCSVRRNICLHVKFTITIRKRWPKFYLKTRPSKGIGNDQLTCYNCYWMAHGNKFMSIHFQRLNKSKKLVTEILARCQFCLFISCMPVSALMAIIHILSRNNNRNSIVYDPGLGHCGLGILKRIPLRQIKRALKRHFFIQSFIY